MQLEPPKSGWPPFGGGSEMVVQPPWDAEVVDEVDVDARLGIQGGPLVRMGFVCPLVQDIHGGCFGGSSR